MVFFLSGCSSAAAAAAAVRVISSKGLNEVEVTISGVPDAHFTLCFHFESSYGWLTRLLDRSFNCIELASNLNCENRITNRSHFAREHVQEFRAIER